MLMTARVSPSDTHLSSIPKLHFRNKAARPYAFQMGFKDQLKAARNAKEYTGQQLADLLGMSKQTISHWEQGRYEPNLAQLALLTEFLEVSCDWLVLGRSAEGLSAEALQQAKFYEKLTPEGRRQWKAMQMVFGSPQ